MESEKVHNDRRTNPREKANPLSALMFIWTFPIFWEGYKKDLLVDDLFSPLKEHSSAYLGDRLERVWNAEIRRCKGKNKTPSFLRAIVKVFGPSIMLFAIAAFISEIGLRIAQPILLGGLISFFTPGSKMTLNEAYIWAVGVVLCSGFNVLFMHPYMMSVMHIGMKARVAACSLVYRKALRLSKISLGQTTVGQIVNLLSNDVNRFDIAFIFLQYLWLGPLQTCIVTYLMWQQVGPAAVIGLVTLFIFIPLQGWLGKKSSSLRMKTAIRTDERVRLMNEIINGIQVIKMYTWEKPFSQLVALARRKEIGVIKKSSYIRGIMMSFIIFHTRAAIFFTILSYVLFGNGITAEKVFVLTSFYNTLRQTMTVFFPQGIQQVAECLISVKRLQKFLLYEESSVASPRDDKANGKLNLENNGIANLLYTHTTKNFEKSGIEAKNACAKWQPDANEHCLSNISCEVVPGQLTVVIGPVGAGKTSFFHALLQELPLTSGSINITGIISYASQEPWLFHGSVRQNILFGEPYIKEKYRQVVKVCALRTDFEQLPYKDKTIVGERGVSLSGGQRARINLARAVYKDADIYLLDDPLSAVDTHVGKHLFEDCIQGYLRNKTVMLITHQLQYLENVDQIILLENGSLKAKGTYYELQKSGLDFTKLLTIKEEESEEVKEIPRGRRLGSRQSSMNSVNSSIYDDSFSQNPIEVGEDMSKGSVKAAVYKNYFVYGGGCCLAIFVLLMFIISQAFASGGDYWITYWVNLEEHVYIDGVYNKTVAASNPNAAAYPFIVSRNMCIYVYSALTVLTVLATIFRSVLFFVMCMTASTNLHDHMFSCISRATMWFFNNNSSGRILNRFSKDMGAIDELLPVAMMDVLQIGFTLLAIIIVVAVINVWLLIPTVCIGVFFYYLRIFYISTSRSVKRLEGVTRSPVFSHLNASLQGLTTIRAFNAQEILVKEFDNHQDLHSSAWFLFIGTSRAFGFWLDIICLIYICFVTLSFLFLGGDSFGGNVGLAISQAIGLTGMFQWGMRQSAELENQMTSVERVLEYSNLEKEPPLESAADKKPRKTWPDEGKIQFLNTHLRYSPTDPWVLKNLNFVIQPKEKVGIVGRTGAGKSSLISALFRLSEIEGTILVDGIDCASVGLHDLRSKISIIPQEPVLFSGTMRNNLDPFDEHNDEVLWSALDEVELRDVVNELSSGLQAQVSEGGSNLSVGQRQLVCLARAIIRNNKILVLDEATANVDPQTDFFIQDTIRKKFADCTVLTIAHRLNTVMDSDKVLVMDAGTMVEFDHPHTLLQNSNGFLYKMVQQTGKTTEENLHKVAADNYASKFGPSTSDR
ncbi:probable multidrug resistance-associated protein lethal(2)03659 [Rhodnius prolixus]|uniref:probable multidrug resistance-associated protein lethal(2)03659 n=1 Tax=Rhodnius prolixus TaxID=13249 RepID=UPI003D18D121